MLCELKLNLCQHSQYCIVAHAQTCVDYGDNVTCICADGWSGSNCGVNTDECEENKCVNGAKCIDKVNGYICKCKKGYSGLYCEGNNHKLFFIICKRKKKVRKKNIKINIATDFNFNGRIARKQ